MSDATDHPADARRHLRWPTYAAVATALALLVGLGTWQLQRKVWKDALLRTIAARTALPPVSVFDRTALGCDAARELDDPCAWRAIRLSGRFVDAPEAHVFISIPRQPNGLNGVGYWVFSLFELAEPVGRESHIWVNRGFVPQARKARETRADALAGRPVEISGVLRQSEPRGRFSGANDWRGNVFYVRAPAEFDPCVICTAHQGCKCRSLAAFDYYVDMTGPAATSDLPFPLAGKLTIPNRHLEYALTWYALAATLAVVAVLALRRR